MPPNSLPSPNPPEAGYKPNDALEPSERRRRLSRLVLLLGALAVFAWFGPKVPRDQTITLEFGQPNVSQVSVSFTDESSAAEPFGGFSLHLANSRSSKVDHVARLPNGSYQFDIVVTRKVDRAQAGLLADNTTTYQRHVTLDGSATTLFLP